MKLTIDDAVVDVAFNPANKNDGRPDAGMTYTVSLRADSATGGARLTVGTDFTPPCVLAVLPEWSTRMAHSVLGLLGFYAPSQSGWMIGRPDAYAFVDGVTYVEPADEELAFMAAFGFMPGARFNLALPMLRAQRAQWLTGTWPAPGADLDVALTAMAGVDDSGNPLEFVMGDAAMTVDEADAAQQALEYPNVGGGGAPESPVVAPDQGDALTVSAADAAENVTAKEPAVHADPIKPGVATRRRRAVKPKTDVITVTNGDMAVEIPVDDEVNPFAIGGV
jgi:hypothetical protein